MSLSRETVYELFNSFVKKKPNFVFLENENEKYTVGEFLKTICTTANYLSEMGVKKGDVVSILCKRDIETIVYFFSCQIMGAIALMVDMHEDLNKLELESGLKISYSIGENRKVIKSSAFPEIKFEALNDSRETTIMISTSGSTGDRKLVIHSQYAFINNAFDSKNYGDYREDDIALAFLPLNHVFAMAMLFTAVCFQFKVFVAVDSDVCSLLGYVDKYHITRFNGVPSILLKMTEMRDGYNVSSLRCAYVGGAPCSKSDYFKIEKNLGIKLISVYGMSECIGISTGAFSDDSSLLADSVGRCYPANDIKILDDGEIMVKSPSMCNGYFNGSLLTKNEYLLTGDIGRIDNDGFLHIIGRKKEIIIRNGINVSISEIEKKLSEVKIFKEYAVVGIDDSSVGEVPALAVVLKESVDNLDINSILSRYLNKQEMPLKIAIVDKIPLLDNGKIDKKSVKKLFSL